MPDSNPENTPDQSEVELAELIAQAARRANMAEANGDQKGWAENAGEYEELRFFQWEMEQERLEREAKTAPALETSARMDQAGIALEKPTPPANVPMQTPDAFGAPV